MLKEDLFFFGWERDGSTQGGRYRRAYSLTQEFFYRVAVVLRRPVEKSKPFEFPVMLEIEIDLQMLEMACKSYLFCWYGCETRGRPWRPGQTIYLITVEESEGFIVDA